MNFKRYRDKNMGFDAFQFSYKKHMKITDLSSQFHFEDGVLFIDFEGDVYSVSDGDYIIENPNGGYAVMPENIFKNQYEEIPQ